MLYILVIMSNMTFGPATALHRNVQPIGSVYLSDHLLTYNMEQKRSQPACFSQNFVDHKLTERYTSIESANCRKPATHTGTL